MRLNILSGTVAWVDRLRWPLADAWKKSTPRQTFVVNGKVEGFVKKAKTFSMYWINRAGHMVSTVIQRRNLESFTAFEVCHELPKSAPPDFLDGDLDRRKHDKNTLLIARCYSFWFHFPTLSSIFEST